MLRNKEEVTLSNRSRSKKALKGSRRIEDFENALRNLKVIFYLQRRTKIFWSAIVANLRREAKYEFVSAQRPTNK